MQLAITVSLLHVLTEQLQLVIAVTGSLGCSTAFTFCINTNIVKRLVTRKHYEVANSY